MNDDKRKQLELAQGIVNRLASNSFSLKGWSAALATGVLAYISKDGIPRTAWIALIPAVSLGILDCAYLLWEHRAINRYDLIASTDKDIGYDLAPIRQKGDLARALCSPAILLFHVP